MGEELNEEIQKIEEEIKKLEGSDQTYGSPSAPYKDSIFKFFREILTSKDNKKTGNLKDVELGVVKMGVRGLFEVGNYARTENLDRVADYMDFKAQNILATSDSRGGFLPQLFVTQIKKEQKVKEPTAAKKSFFGKTKEPEGEQ